MIDNLQYSDTILDEMQQLYGDGYLSPGGADEVDDLLDGLVLKNARILDVGCGVGGAAIRMVEIFGAKKVVGIDVEARSIEKAVHKIKELNLTNRIQFDLVESGEIPFSDEVFDIVFCKDVVCHLNEKRPLFNQIFRVLRSGGIFVLGDWIKGVPIPGESVGGVRKVCRPDGLILFFEPLKNYLDALKLAGFFQISTRSHSQWLLKRTENELRTVISLHESSGEMGKRAAVTERRLESLKTGRLEHWHFYAIRP